MIPLLKVPKHDMWLMKSLRKDEKQIVFFQCLRRKRYRKNVHLNFHSKIFPIRHISRWYFNIHSEIFTIRRIFAIFLLAGKKVCESATLWIKESENKTRSFCQHFWPSVESLQQQQQKRRGSNKKRERSFFSNWMWNRALLNGRWVIGQAWGSWSAQRKSLKVMPNQTYLYWQYNICHKITIIFIHTKSILRAYKIHIVFCSKPSPCMCSFQTYSSFS